MSSQPLRSVAATVLAAVLAVLLLLPSAACGGSGIGAAYDAFNPVADRILTREDLVWRQVIERNQSLDDDPSGARFYPYIESTAMPFYDTCAKELAEADPGPAESAGPVREAWAALGEFIAARQKYLRLELERRQQMQFAPQLLGLRDLQDRAASAVVDYERAVADDVPDHRFGQLQQIVQRVTQEQLPAALSGERTVAAVVEHVRLVALPGLERLRDGRFEDDERSRLLRRAIVLNEESMRKIAELAEPLLGMARAITESTQSAKDADDARARCWAKLADARRER